MRTADIRSIYKVAVRFIGRMSGEFSQEQKEAANELKRRIRRLENDYNRLIHINSLLCEAKLPKIHFDETTGTMTVTNKGKTQSIKLNRADPNIPVKIKGSTAIGAYTASDSNKTQEPEEIDELKMLMEQLLEHYYNNAFRITKLTQALTGKRKYHCPEITIVRNKLVEHPEAGSLYSFGFGSNGPVVKPMHRGPNTWNDNGLIPNTAALVASLIGVFSVDVD
jgi:hypothetical protein